MIRYHVMSSGIIPRRTNDAFLGQEELYSSSGEASRFTHFNKLILKT